DRIRPVVDLVETNDFAVQNGLLAAGAVEDLEESDDVSVRLATNPASSLPEPIQASCSFALNGLQPTTVTLDVEARCDGPVDQKILVHNVVTDAWDVLDARRLTHLDRHHTLTLANPADYVSATGKVIELRLTETEVGSGTGAGSDTRVGTGGSTLLPGGTPGTGTSSPPARFH